MWSAIKNDLFEFVSTVQSDTKETLAKVIETRKGADEDSPDAQKKKKNHEVWHSSPFMSNLVNE
jgi:hypothetical protein